MIPPYSYTTKLADDAIKSRLPSQVQDVKTWSTFETVTSRQPDRVWAHTALRRTMCDQLNTHMASRRGLATSSLHRAHTANTPAMIDLYASQVPLSAIAPDYTLDISGPRLHDSPPNVKEHFEVHKLTCSHCAGT